MNAQRQRKKRLDQIFQNIEIPNLKIVGQCNNKKQIQTFDYDTFLNTDFTLQPNESINYQSIGIKEGNETFKSKANIFKDLNGRLWVDCLGARVGIMTYYDKEGNASRELKKPEALFNDQTINSMFGCPVTVEHPLEGIVNSNNFKLLSVGTVMYPPKPYQGYFLRMRLEITDDQVSQEIIKRLSQGKTWEVSCGYSADLDPESGKWNGMEYDAVHTNILYNHIALVEKGRAGQEVCLLKPKDYEDNKFNWTKDIN